jgi:iron complex outermembrane receptor protein
MLKNHNKKMLQTRKKLLCGLIGATLLWSEASIVCAAEAAETPQSAEEQSVADPKKQSFELDKLIITAEGYHLPPAYAGGQIARGSRVGLLGNMDFLDTPFNTTSYTAATIENQQDQGLAGVLALDPAVRDITGTSYSPTWPSGDFR